MSLDVYLTLPVPESATPRQAIFIRRDGANVEIGREEWDALHPGVEPAMATINAGDPETTEIYSANITHNLTRMASAAGIYEALWRPGEVGITKAAQLIEPLARGLALLKADPAGFEALNAPNGWGRYEHFVPFVENYLAACRENPDADVHVSR